MNAYDVAKHMLGSGRERDAARPVQAQRNWERSWRPSRAYPTSPFRHSDGSTHSPRRSRPGMGKRMSLRPHIDPQTGFKEIYEHKSDLLESLMEYCTSCEQMQNFLGGETHFDEATKFRPGGLQARLSERSRNPDGARPTCCKFARD